MKSVAILTFFLLIHICVSAQNYAVDQLPVSLKSRATAVLREESIVLDMKSDNSLRETVTRAVTILNESGEKHAKLLLYYNKGKSIQKITGAVYDENGMLLKKFNQKNFSDHSASGESNMYDDFRVKYYSPAAMNYPYTIVYSYEVKHSQTLYVPYWKPNDEPDIAVEKSVYQFICKPDQKIRIKEENIPQPVIVQTNDKSKTYLWEARNLPARKEEPFAPIHYEKEISVKLAPEKFSYFKKTGTVVNWEQLGKWVYDELLEDKQDLPSAAKQKVKDIIAAFNTDKEKANALYQYMQSKTRYISIQVGIGGIEPFPASYVEKLGYGDCKALVNYMHALLTEANIPSYYCVVEAGNNKIDVDKDFANIVDGNHVILCVPFAGDTTWLECTNNKIPFGFLGDFTDDRLVLACTPEGGKLLHTPKYTSAQNLQYRKGVLSVDSVGNVSGHIHTRFTGTQFDNRYSFMAKNSTALDKALREVYDINNISFNKVKYAVQSTSDTLTLTEDMDIVAYNYVVKNGSDLIIYPNLFNTFGSIPESKSRIGKVYINRGFTDIDEIEFSLAANIHQGVEPIDKIFTCPMGKYEIKVMPGAHSIKFYRRMEIYDGTYEAADYEKFFNFSREVSSMDRGKYTLPIL